MAARYKRALMLLGLALTVPGAVMASTPINDVHPGLTIEAIPFVQTIDTTGASIYALEPSPTCRSGTTNSVWYNFTPSADVDVVADTVGSDYDTVIDVFTGTVNADFTVSALLSVGCNNDAGAGTQSELSFHATAGERYLIRVSAVGGFGGFLTFHLNPAVADASMAQPTPLGAVLTVLWVLILTVAVGITRGLRRKDVGI
jgi:hypothetical protein